MRLRKDVVMKTGIDKLREDLLSRERIAVALSGGLDSSVLLAFAVSVLGAQNCLALTAHTPYMMHEEIDEAKKLCRRLGVEHICVKLPVPKSIALNPPNRCYLCKKQVFTQLKELAARGGFFFVVDGTNHDDLSDYRPGMKALQELGVFNPLKEAGMGKDDIRELGRSLDMEEGLIRKPAYACLLTRLEHDKPFTEDDLYRVDAAETWLRERGFPACRVRVHGTLARIELDRTAWPSFLHGGAAWQAELAFREMGFEFVTLDLKGYTRGSMNRMP